MYFNFGICENLHPGKKEKADYDTADAELAETVDMLRRAIAILEKEMSKTGFLQTSSMDKVRDALSALVMAEGVRGVSGADASKLASLLQDNTAFFVVCYFPLSFNQQQRPRASWLFCTSFVFFSRHSF